MQRFCSARTKLPPSSDEKFKNVINDLEKQIKSVRFDDESDGGVTERVSEWVDDQNKHILGDTVLTLTEEVPKKVRQRIPPRNLTPSPSEVSEEAPAQTDEQIYTLYKSGVEAPSTTANNSDFLIQRPKLIVPVHTNAVRRRRTGNLQCKSEEVVKSDSGELFFWTGIRRSSYVLVWALPRISIVGVAALNGRFVAGKNDSLRKTLQEFGGLAWSG